MQKSIVDCVSVVKSCNCLRVKSEMSRYIDESAILNFAVTVFSGVACWIIFPQSSIIRHVELRGRLDGLTKEYGNGPTKDVKFYILGPTARWPDNPSLRKPIGSTAHWSENPLALVRRPIGPKKCCWSCRGRAQSGSGERRSFFVFFAEFFSVFCSFR